MAINNVITDDWSGHSHGEVEEALKDKLSEMSQGIEEAAQAGYAPPAGGIPYSDLAKAVRDILDSVSDKVDEVNGKGLSTEDFTSAFKAKLESLGNYDDTQIWTAVNTLQSTLEGLATVATSGSYNDLKDKPVIPEGSVVDDALSDSSENAVQNKVVKAAIDGLQDALNTLIGGNVQGAIDTFNEVRAFLNGINTDDPTLANQLLALNNSISSLEDTLASKVEKETGKGLSSNDYTTAEMTKLENLPTSTELTMQLGTKANDNAVVKSISVNGGSAQTPTNGNVNIEVSGEKGDDGVTPHIGQNGHWWIGPETDSANDTGIIAQGPAGTSITDANLEIGDALNGDGDVLGMRGAMMIKGNIDTLYASVLRLYTKLANMAFWDAEDKAAAAPTALDWSLPKHTVTLDKTSLTANAMITDANDQEIAGTSVSVDEGSVLTLKIKPRNGYALTAASATIGGVSQTLTENNGVYTLAIDSVTSAITVAISATAEPAHSVTLNLTGCTKTSGPTSIINGGGGTFVFAANEDYTLPTQVTVTNATVTSWDNGTLVISNVTGDVTIMVVAIFTGWYVAPKNDTSSVFGVQLGATIIHTGSNAGNVIKDTNEATILCPRCNNSNLNAIYGVPAGDSPKNFYQANGNIFFLKMKPLDSGCYALNVASYANDYSFISRDSYKDVGVNENWETSFNLPENAVHLKVFVCRRDSYGGSVLEMQSIYDNWDNTTMKYK